jgi:hypothetical protein
MPTRDLEPVAADTLSADRCTVTKEVWRFLIEKISFFVKRFALFLRYQSGRRFARDSGNASAILGLPSEGSPDGSALRTFASSHAE